MSDLELLLLALFLLLIVLGPLNQPIGYEPRVRRVTDDEPSPPPGSGTLPPPRLRLVRPAPPRPPPTSVPSSGTKVSK